MDNRPIGIFDSGIGGLTVAKEIIKVLPSESIVYIGDTARVPYGPRSKEVVTKFAMQMAIFLLKKNIKALVIACNTISGLCYDEIKEAVSPVITLGVIKPAVKKAIETTRNEKIGVIGTVGTVKSGSYQKMLKFYDSNAHIIASSCPLFVPMAEEGLNNHFATWQIAKEYLDGFKSTGIDTLILGCTHFPLLTDVIQDIVGPDVTLVDSAKPTAGVLKQKLEELNLLNKGNHFIKILVTDAPSRVNKVAGNFFGNHLPVKPAKITL